MEYRSFMPLPRREVSYCLHSAPDITVLVEQYGVENRVSIFRPKKMPRETEEAVNPAKSTETQAATVKASA